MKNVSRFRADHPDLLFTPRERRRLARAGSAPGRRRAARVPERRPQNDIGTKPAIEREILIAVPGLRPHDLHLGSPRPGVLVATFSRPMTQREIEVVRLVLADAAIVGTEIHTRAIEGFVA